MSTKPRLLSANRFSLVACGLASVLMSSHCTCQRNPFSSAPPLELKRVVPDLQFAHPLFLVQAKSDDSYWHVGEQTGIVWRFKGVEATAKEEFLNITARVDANYAESGLLGMAFHPKYPETREVFVSYTAKGQGGAVLESRLSRFTVNDTLAKVDVDSEQVILSVNQPFENHNGGHIAFGPDGFLYWGLGDGGSASDPNNEAQNAKSWLGKILRIDVDGAKPYAVPPSNPFAQGKNGRPEVYAFGFRNPWRFSFDRKDGTLWLADVGQDEWEEINIILPGGNYGWRIREGKHCFIPKEDCPTHPIDPVAEYNHSKGISVTGGYVYRGPQNSRLQGMYIFGDYGSGRIWALATNTSTPTAPVELLDSTLQIASFAELNNGELYALDSISGGIYSLVSSND